MMRGCRGCGKLIQGNEIMGIGRISAGDYAGADLCGDCDLERVAAEALRAYNARIDALGIEAWPKPPEAP